MEEATLRKWPTVKLFFSQHFSHRDRETPHFTYALSDVSSRPNSPIGVHGESSQLRQVCCLLPKLTAPEHNGANYPGCWLAAHMWLRPSWCLFGRVLLVACGGPGDSMLLLIPLVLGRLPAAAASKPNFVILFVDGARTIE